MDKFTCKASEAKATLEKYGVAIVPGVLDDKECEDLLSGMWSYFEHTTQKWSKPIARNDSSTWRGFYNMFPIHSMLFQYFNIGHTQAIWDVRQNPKVIDVFKELWGTSDLLVSFDGASFSPPHETTKRGIFRKVWMHTDQSYTRNGFECVQGWVTALPVNPGDATLAVLEGSHRLHKQVGEKFGITDKGDWYKLTPEQQAYYLEQECQFQRIECPKGSLVLWDSRTIHCGVEALKTRAQPNFRCVAYVCYMPRAQCCAKNLQKKIKAFEEMRMTTHWPCKVKLFGKMPRTYGNEIPELTAIPAPVVSKVGRSLIGY